MLGRIYTRQIGDSQEHRIDESMLKKSIEEYKKITELEPKDTDSWLMLGRLYKVAQNSVEAQNAYKKRSRSIPIMRMRSPVWRWSMPIWETTPPPRIF